MKYLKLLNKGLWVLFLLSLSSCSSILGLVVGVHNPKKETVETLNDFLVKNRIDTSNVYVFEKSALKNLYKSTYKPNYEPGLRPVQMMCFNREGQLIMHWSSCEGPLRKLGTLETLPPKNSDPFFPGITLANQLENYRTLEGFKIDDKKFTDKDYVFVVYWAVFTDKQARKLIYEVENYAKNYPDAKIEILKVNIDKLEG